jgi:hypothetical protein
MFGSSLIERLESRQLFSVNIPAAAQVNPGFTPGDMLADPIRNNVYVLDQTNYKVIEINTDLGRKTGQVSIADLPTSLAINPQATELYVSSKTGNSIQVFSLPDLAPLRTLDISQPNNIAVGIGDRVFVTSNSSWTGVRQVDSITGAVRATFGSYYNALPTTNAAGTKLYVSELGLSTTGTVEYDISNGKAAPTQVRSYGTNMSNGRDLEVDEQYNRLYAMSGGVYGVYSVDRDSNVGTFWSFGGAAYGASVDVAEGVSWFYATSQDSYSGGIFKYDRAGGTVLERYVPTGTYKTVWDVAETPNGNAVYLSDNGYSGTATQLGIIGKSTLTIGSVPNARFVAQVAASPSRFVSFDGTGSSDYESNGVIASYAWDFGDGATGVGATASHTYAADGKYVVKLTVADGQGNTDEFVKTLNISAAPVAASAAAITLEETPVNIPLQGSDVDGDALTYLISTPAAHGKVQLSGNTATYIPNKDYFGDDSFVYVVSDGGRATPATISIRVNNLSDAPVARDDVVARAATGATSVNVLANDVDADGDSLTITFGQAANGTVQLSGNKLLYTPNGGFTGADSFTYSISDGVSNATAKVYVSSAAASLQGDWTTYGGSAAHTGYFAGSAGAGQPIAGWSLPSGSSIRGNPLAVAAGKVFAGSDTTAGYVLTAYDQVSGQLLWKHVFPTGFSLNPPTYYNGRLYFQRCNHSSDSQLWAIDASNGTTIWSKAFQAQWESYYAPAVDSNGIWINAGYYGGMLGFKHDGTQIKNLSLAQYDDWTPSILNGSIYSYVAGGLVKYDATGATLWTNAKSWSWSGWSMNRTSALAGNQAYLVGNPDFYSVDLTTGQTLWTVAGNFTGTPAVAGGVAFALQGATVKSYNTVTGALLTTYTGTGTLLEQPIVTDDSVIAASSSTTFIFDRASGALRSTLPYGGKIELSNNQLFIVSSDGAIRTYNFASPLAADAGGTVHVNEGSSLVLQGVAASTTGTPITAWEWDLDYDGLTFNVDSGAQNPTFSAANIDGFGRRRVALRVRDSAGNVSPIAGADVLIDSAPPTALFGVTPVVGMGGAVTAQFTAASDVAADQAFGLRYSFDFNNDGDFTDPGDVANSTSSSASFTFTTAGTYVIHGRIADKDGAASDYTATTVVDPLPVPSAGGPYSVAEGASVLLQGSATLSPGRTATAYEWDFDYDGVTFNTDATGVSVAFAPADGPWTTTIALRVTDGPGRSGIATTTATISNTPPTGTFSSGAAVAVTNASVVKFTGVADRSVPDLVAGLTYAYDFNNDGDFSDPGDVAASMASSASFVFPAAGSYIVHGRVADKDGGASDYTTTVVVNPPTVSTTLRDLRAAADAYVQDGSSAGTNFGLKTELNVRKSSTSGSNRESYLRFALAGGAANSVIDAAHLRFFTRLSAAGSVQLDLYAVSNTTWSETGINWNNRPAAGTSIIASKTIASTTATWIDFDVSNYVKQQRAAGATAVAFVLRGHASSTPYAIISSDEATANRPALQLTEHIAPVVLLSSATTSVLEGGTSSALTARLSTQPSGPVTVSITRSSGDADVTALPATLTFTPFNWNVAQPITLAAAEDADLTNGAATFSFTANGGYGATSLVATEKDNDLRPTADSYVRDGTSAASNFGTATALQVRKSTTAGNTRSTVLKFDLTSLTTISSATLRLYGKLDVTTNPSVSVQAFAASSTTWTETGVTWNNKPTASGASLGQISVVGTTASWYTIDLTAWLQSQKAAGKTTAALVLTSPTTTTSMAVFNSDEAASNGPQMVVKR